MNGKSNIIAALILGICMLLSSLIIRDGATNVAGVISSYRGLLGGFKVEN